MGREQRQFIQFIAALTMLIDHIGMVFFPSVIGFRAIGRLSFPLFAFGIAEGVRYTHCFLAVFRANSSDSSPFSADLYASVRHHTGQSLIHAGMGCGGAVFLSSGEKDGCGGTAYRLLFC